MGWKSTFAVQVVGEDSQAVIDAIRDCGDGKYAIEAENNQADETCENRYQILVNPTEESASGVTLEDALNSTRRGEAYAELKVINVMHVVGTGYYLKQVTHDKEATL